MSLIHRLVRCAHKTFSQVNDVSVHERLQELKATASQLNARDVNFERPPNENTKAPVTYVRVYHHPKFSMGMFVLKKGTRIPLHDHPQMYGIIKTIHGTINIKSYTIKQNTKSTNEREDEESIPVTKLQESRIDSQSDACLLQPLEGNIHEISSVGGAAAFLDILAPPYEDGTRDCHYYDVVEGSANQQPRLRRADCPVDFWCDEAPYEGPSLREINLD